MTAFEFALGIITLMTTGGGLASLQALRSNKKSNKKIEEALSEIDAKQNERIEKIESKIDEIFDRIKDKDFVEKLQRDVKKKIESIILVKSPKNTELLHTISNGEKNLIHFVSDILAENFEFDSEKLKCLIKYYLKNVKFTIDRNKLNVINPENFLELLENHVIKVEIENFIISFMDFKKLQNGERRAELQKHIFIFIENVVIKTIDLFENYLNGK